MEILNRKLIKAEARSFIGQDKRWLKMALACLPLFILQGAVSSGVSFVVRIGNNDNLSFNTSVGGPLISLLFIPFTFAIAGYFLNHLRGFNPEWKSIYKEGIDNYGKYFAVGFMTNLSIFLWTLLFIIPGIIKEFEYFFVGQIIHDNPNLDYKQAKDLSGRMTKGFKGQLFIMGLSFILWYMLVGITFGIALLYVSPYISCTTAMYYENLKHNAIVTGIARPEEFGIVPVQEEAETNEYEPAVAPSYIKNEVSDIQTPEVIEESAKTEVLEEEPAEAQEEQTDIEE